MKLKSENGLVQFLMVAGKDVVYSEMPITIAEQLCSKGTTSSTKFHGYPICVDDKYYFAGIPVKPTINKSKTTDENQ